MRSVWLHAEKYPQCRMLRSTFQKDRKRIKRRHRLMSTGSTGMNGWNERVLIGMKNLDRRERNHKNLWNGVGTPFPCLPLPRSNLSPLAASDLPLSLPRLSSKTHFFLSGFHATHLILPLFISYIHSFHPIFPLCLDRFFSSWKISSTSPQPS